MSLGSCSGRIYDFTFAMFAPSNSPTAACSSHMTFLELKLIQMEVKTCPKALHFLLNDLIVSCVMHEYHIFEQCVLLVAANS